jgi:hypothetical protein
MVNMESGYCQHLSMNYYILGAITNIFPELKISQFICDCSDKFKDKCEEPCLDRDTKFCSFGETNDILR